jgi:hypothetical protein
VKSVDVDRTSKGKTGELRSENRAGAERLIEQRERMDRLERMERMERIERRERLDLLDRLERPGSGGRKRH